MTFKGSCLFLLIAIALITSACSGHDVDVSLNSTDIYFIKQATGSNLNEIRISTIAHYNGHENTVRIFADQVIFDDSIAVTSMDSLVGALPYNGDRPLEPDSEHKVQALMLQTLLGYTFDTAYINGQTLDHQSTLSVFQTEISKGNNPLVKQYAIRFLPMVQTHLEQALNIQKTLK